MSQNIVPSNMALQQTKLKLKSASKGKDLLKRKADALKVKFRETAKKLIIAKKDLGNKYNQSLVFLAKANWATGEVSRIVDENVKTKSDVKLSLTTLPVAGVTLPEFKIRNIEEEKFGDVNILGITGGGQTLNVTKKHFYDFLTQVVEIATLQTAYMSLDEALKITSRRVNALEYIVVPRIQYVIKYIDSELQERAREEKFKIKSVIATKKKKAELAEQQKKTENTGEPEAEEIFEVEEDEEDIDQSEKLFK